MNAPQEIITTIDVIWFFFSVVTTALLGLVAWLTKKMHDNIDTLNDKIENILISGAVVRQELHDHINNDKIHCSFPVCRRDN